MNVRPLHDHLFVKRLETPAQRIGTIVIPDSAQEKPQEGTVIAAGRGKVNKDGVLIPIDIKVGDTILFGKYSGQKIALDGVEYLVMTEGDVLGVNDRIA